MAKKIRPQNAQDAARAYRNAKVDAIKQGFVPRGAGAHPDKKAVANKRACRQKNWE